MKKTLRLVGVAAMVLLLAASCKKEEKNNGEKQMMTFSAGIEQGNSKTYLTPDGPHAYKQLWTEGDQISVNGHTITLDAGCGGKEVGTFSGEAVKADHYYAVYPESAWQTGNKAVFEIPATQNYNGNNYPLNFNGPMYASSDDQTLQFHNLCGLMQLNLKSGVGKPLTVTKLEVVSYLVNECGLYGTSEPVDLTSGNPTLTIANTNNKSVTLNCGEGVEIGTEQATPFVIALPPYTFGYNATIGEGGLFVNVYVDGTEGIYASIQYKKEIIVKAGEVAYTEATICPQIFLATTAIDEDQDVTATTATVGGSVMSLEHGLNVVEKGIVYQLSTAGTVLDPAIACYIPATTTKGNNFSAELTGLESGKTYYCWAYAKCKYRDAVDYDFIQYGGFISFTTKNSSVPDGFVDFGTHVNGFGGDEPLYWAMCNVGANGNVTNGGGYYMWGHVENCSNLYCQWQCGQEDNAYTDYRFVVVPTDGNNLTKYCFNPTKAYRGLTDNKGTLESSDDAATHANSKDRMPSKAEWEELIGLSYRETVTNYNGVSVEGCIFYKAKDDADKGKKDCATVGTYTLNDTHIFLPAGYRSRDVNQSQGIYYWSRTLDLTKDGGSTSAYLYDNGNGVVSFGRFYGFRVRPVREQNP